MTRPAFRSAAAFAVAFAVRATLASEGTATEPVGQLSVTGSVTGSQFVLVLGGLAVLGGVIWAVARFGGE